jgi:hypothetical protein
MLTGTAPFSELPTEGAVIKAVTTGRRPPRTPLCSGTPSLEDLWELLQKCWDASPENRPKTSQVVERLMGNVKQAKKSQSLKDWDDSFTSRFRRQLMDKRPLPSVDKLERIILGDG